MTEMEKKKPTLQNMPALRKSDGSTKVSMKIAGALKQKASKVIKAILPKKKRRGPTNDTVLLASTSPETPTQTSDNDDDTQPGNPNKTPKMVYLV